MLEEEVWSPTEKGKCQRTSGLVPKWPASLTQPKFQAAKGEAKLPAKPIP